MIGTTKEKSGYVRNCQTDEGYGTAECCGSGREQSRSKEQKRASARDADAQITSIVVAQQEGIERLDEQDGKE